MHLLPVHHRLTPMLFVGLTVAFLGTDLGVDAAQLREYYVGAVEVEWDYAPSGMNKIKNTEITRGSYEAQYLLNDTNRIGRKYKKAVYQQYTDDTYSTQIAKPVWLGTLGPVLYAEVGDTIMVYFKNMASRPYTMHPHGVKYEKDSEGAVYEDNTSGKDKADENIPPGGSHTYKWIANDAAGPAAQDVNCTPWPYHSHITTPSDTNSGLIGSLIICKEGILDENGRRTDVQKDFVVMFSIIDENLSYYLQENIATYIGNSGDLDTDDDEFLQSNLMDGINGYLYGNLPGLSFCLGDKVDWHVIAFGTEADIHTVYFHGNLLNFQGRRRDSLSISPAVSMSASMMANNPGTWLLTSASTTHFKDGSQALYVVADDCGSTTAPDPPTTGQQRNYFIAAEYVTWDYAPVSRVHEDGTNFTQPGSDSYPFFTKDNNRIGGIYKKAVFVGYTNDSFTVRTATANQQQRMGLLGPVIRGEVGDVITVTLRNNLVEQNVSLLAHGVTYTKANEGQAYNDGTTGSDRDDESVVPGSMYTYTWTLPAHSAPTDQDPACITWVYTSAVDYEADVFAGLVGPILVCKAGSLDSQTGMQLDVDREFFLLFTTFDENLSWLLSDNIANYSADPGAVDLNDEDFVVSNQMASINGYSYNNLFTIAVNVSETVSWHLMAIGKFSDEHTVSFEKQTLVHNSRRTSGVPIFPGVSETAIMTADIPGTFEIECETNSHFVNGMVASFTVQASADQTAPVVGDKTRKYYVAIVERIWDYVPNKWDQVRSENITDPDSEGFVFAGQGATTIGGRYKKALYREFTDETFTTERVHSEHLGVLGPLLRMEVGETVTVVVKNMAAAQRYALEPHGVLVSVEGSGGDKGIAPGATKTFEWLVPERSGPTATDSNCVVYAYYSNMDKERDTNSGLVGPMVICRPGVIGEDGLRTDVTLEFPLLFTVLDENKSWYLDDNIEMFCGTPGAVDRSDADFEESNLMHGINGRLYTNLEGLDMTVDDVVEWYLLGLGDEVDVHSVHFHGQTVTYKSTMMHRVDVFELFSGVYGSVTMTADNPGRWLLHCHVNDHIIGGMETMYNVYEKPTTMVMTTASACCITGVAVIVSLGAVMARNFN